MQYANLENEEIIEDKVADDGDEDVIVARINGGKTAGRKDSFWLIALVLTILLIGSLLFFVTHTGGTHRKSYHIHTTTQTPTTTTTTARSKSLVLIATLGSIVDS